jgi:multidrug resistance protein MdtO
LALQVAVAFCLINLQEFHFQASLTIARDRVIGILLGLLMMWFFFDQLASTSAGLAMRKKFVSVLRLLAQLTRWEDMNSVEASVKKSYELREAINVEFNQVRSLSDVVLFEFGPSRLSDLEFRDHIRQWQPQLRTLFVIRVAFLKYRLQTPGFEIPESIRLRQAVYDQASARVLDKLADQIEGQSSRLAGDEQERHELQELRIAAEEEASRSLPVAQAQSFTKLVSEIDALTNSLAAEIGAGLSGHDLAGPSG